MGEISEYKDLLQKTMRDIIMVRSDNNESIASVRNDIALVIKGLMPALQVSIWIREEKEDLVKRIGSVVVKLDDLSKHDRSEDEKKALTRVIMDLMEAIIG